MAPTIATPERLETFLHALAESANVTSAALHVGINRQHLYRLRDEDDEFRAAWDAAVKLGTGALEDEATRRAKEGWDEPVYYQGDQCGVVRKFSDTLLIFLLKARDPAKYREKLDLTHAAPNGGPIQTVSTELRIDAGTDAGEAARIYQQIIQGR